MADIDVVVGIVTYKSASLTVDCLRSLEPERATPGLNIRVIVVDNASGDVPSIAHAIGAHNWASWVRLIEAPKNGGFAYGNNVALQAAFEGTAPRYFYMLNPDTQVVKGAIGALVSFLEDHPKAGIAGGRVESPDGEIGPFAFRFPSLLSELERGLELGVATNLLKPWAVTIDPGETPQQADWVGGASMMIRRDVIEAIGGLDENYFLYFEETDFCLRAKKAGFSIWYVPDSRIIHFEGQSTKKEAGAAPQRVSAHWFESRRRYFLTNHGLAYAIAADAIAIAAHGVGFLKGTLLGRKDSRAMNFFKDLLRHSLLWPKNRKASPIKHFVAKSVLPTNS